MNIHDYNFEKIDKKRYPCVKGIYRLLEYSFKDIKNRNFDQSIEISEKGKKICEKLKSNAIKNKDEYTANLSFLFKIYFDLLISISKFWKVSLNLEYQDAWKYLQDSIDCTRTLKKFLKNKKQLSIDKIYRYLILIEKLYPYQYFISAEMISTRTCSICKKSCFDPNCTHISGELYWGEKALEVVKDIEFLGTALVEKPVDKRCIIMLNLDKNKIKDGPFKAIHYLIQNSKFPLQEFNLKITKRILPRAFYDGWSKDSFCPCRSKTKFKDCCYDKEFISNPHYNLILKSEILLQI